MRKIEGIGVKYYLWGQEPLQAFGNVRGDAFRFRAEGDSWEIEVADRLSFRSENGAKPSQWEPDSDSTPCWVRTPRLGAGQMSHDEAASLIDTYIRKVWEATF